MSASPSLDPIPNNPPPLSLWELRAAEQLSMCLAREGRREDLEKLLQDWVGSPREAALRFAISLQCIRRQEWETAIVHLRRVLAQSPDHAGAHTLARRVIPHLAYLKFSSGDWEGLSKALATALEFGIDGGAAPELEPYRKVLPVCLIKVGRRDEAARIWAEELRTNPGNPRLLHNLALLYYWWALQEEKNDRTSGHNLWELAIAHWIVVTRLDEFWVNWRKEKEGNWGIKLADGDLDALRTALITDRLANIFQDRASTLKEGGQELDARLYDDNLTSLELEQKSADSWRRAIQILSPLSNGRLKPEARWLLILPGGYLLFRHLGLLSEVGAHIDAVAEASPGDDCVTKLRIYYSPAGLGKICVALEDRNDPDQAIELLKRLPQDSRNLPETRYLLSSALCAKACAVAARGRIEDAFEQWCDATRRTEKAIVGIPAESPFRALLQGLLGQISTQVEKAIQREAGQWKDHQRLDEAIALLEKAVAVYPLAGLKEYLCIFYCDRGAQVMGKKSFADARQEFSKALKLKSDYQRARIGMATAYNNEAVSKDNPKDAIPLFKKALEFEPDSQPLKENLARAYNSRAVDILNGLSSHVQLAQLLGRVSGSIQCDCDEAINLLKRAIKILNPGMDDQKLLFLEFANDSTIEEISRSVEDQQYALVLKHYAIAHKFRRQLSGR